MPRADAYPIEPFREPRLIPSGSSMSPPASAARPDRTAANPHRNRVFRFRLLLGLALPMLQSCIVVPRTFQVYDPDCHVVSRQMDLQTVQIASIQGCSNDGCAALVVAAAATVAASAVISGSIVVVGNVVYWFEKRGRCRRDAE